MATGYFNRVLDTVVSGTALLSTLSGEDTRALEFAAAVRNPLPLALSATTAGNYPSVDQLVQATIDGLVVTSSDAAAYAILLGTDSSTQAAAYIALFDLKSTNDVRVLKFINGGITGTAGTLTKNITLANASGGTSKVLCRLADGAAGSPVVFTAANTVSSISGLQRDVFVSATSFTSGSEIVRFTVGSANSA